MTNTNTATIAELKQQIKNMETRPALDKNLLQTAFAQSVAAAVIFDDEKTGSRLYAALEKALKTAQTNKTIEFKNGILRFVSTDSSKQRKVTSAGCPDNCDCGNEISYHVALYILLERYCNLLDEQRLAATNFPVISKSEITAEVDDRLREREVENVKPQRSWVNDIDAPYLKNSSNKPVERLAGIRI